MIAMSAVVALSEHVAGLVVVLATVYVADVLAVVHVSAPVEGHSRTSLTASDGCPLGMMLGTVAEAADMQVAVLVAVLVAVQVAVSTAVQEPLLAGRCGFSLRDVGTFFTLAGGEMACSLAWLGGTLADLMGGALDETGVAGTTVPGDLVAEVLGRDLESLALGERRGEVPFLQEDGPDVGLRAAVEPADSEEEEAEEEDVDNRNNIIMQYFQ
ncbi:hypothetical protein NDU88_004253 [Pleurodeles waltl]|uniref:Uncharacterized protein n=1 Tax=Pleurodeles waltl TaxID=8319 RepID=A0AAV7W7L0_PLEWA|nr:hypothetical protein NDU88_004253 [Pleurodeles waltl]